MPLKQILDNDQVTGKNETNNSMQVELDAEVLDILEVLLSLQQDFKPTQKPINFVDNAG